MPQVSKRLLEQFLDKDSNLEKKARIHYKPLQPGDVLETYADLTKSHQDLGYTPKISLQQGLEKFINWYKEAKPWLEFP